MDPMDGIEAYMAVGRMAMDLEGDLASEGGSEEAPPPPPTTQKKLKKKNGVKKAISSIFESTNEATTSPSSTPPTTTTTTSEKPEKKKKKATIPTPSVTLNKIITKKKHAEEEKEAPKVVRLVVKNKKQDNDEVILSNCNTSNQNNNKPVDWFEKDTFKAMEGYVNSMIADTSSIPWDTPITMKVGAITIDPLSCSPNGVVMVGRVKESCGINHSAMPPTGGMVCMSIPSNSGSTMYDTWGELLDKKRVMGVNGDNLCSAISMGNCVGVFEAMEVEDRGGDSSIFLRSSGAQEESGDAKVIRESMFTLFSCPNVTMEPFVHYSSEKGMLSFHKCSNLRIAGNMFSSSASTSSNGIARYGVRLVDCSNVVIDGCSFYDCGVLIQGKCHNITLKKCKMVMFKDPYYGGDQHPLVEIDSSDKATSVHILESEFKVLIKSKYNTKLHISNGFCTTVTPCFIQTHGEGSCTLSVFKSTIIGAIGVLGSRTEYSFEECEFNMDGRVMESLDTPVHRDQGGLERTLRILGPSSTGVFKGCWMMMGTRICIEGSGNNKATFDGCRFFNGMRSSLGSSPIEVVGEGCIISIVGYTTLGLPSSLDMYSGGGATFKHGILCRTSPGTLLHMDGELRISFYYHLYQYTSLPPPPATYDPKLAMETLISKAVFKSLRLFDDGVLSLPMVFCKGDNFKFGASLEPEGALITPLSDAVFKSFFLLNEETAKYVFHAKGRFFGALSRGVELVSSGVGNRSKITLQKDATTIVMSSMLVEKDLHIIGGKIIIIPPNLLVIPTPVHIRLEGIQVENISNTGMKTFFSHIPTSTPAYEIPWVEDPNSLFSSVVLATHNCVVDASDCHFKMDIGCCSKNVGVCVVEKASVACFKRCSFETIMPSGFLSLSHEIIQDMTSGPGVSVCSAPSWGRVAFRDCDGMDNVSGGCVVVSR